jgi:hypothetical protein
MNPIVTRRGWLAVSALAAATAMVPSRGYAAPPADGPYE